MYLVIQLLGIYKAYVSNLSLLVCLEPFKKFSVGGWWWWWVGNTVNIVFCFGPRLGLKTEVSAQAEQFLLHKAKFKEKRESRCVNFPLKFHPCDYSSPPTVPLKCQIFYETSISQNLSKGNSHSWVLLTIESMQFAICKLQQDV